MDILNVIDFFEKIIKPENIINYGGLGLLLFVVYAETGLFVGFFLPGDSLMFTTGLLTATKVLDYPIGIIVLLVHITAFAGNQSGYFFGRYTGMALFKRKESLLFKPSHLILAKNFYDKHGGKALILGQFLPIVRTFSPIVAGVINMNYSQFFILSLTGTFIWIYSLIFTGYFLGIQFPYIKNYLDYIVIFLIIITTIPIIIGYRKNKKKP